jgi:hypothetical protein
VPESGGEIPVSSNISVGETRFTYERLAPVRAGAFSVTVPYAGTYTVGNRTVRVTNRSVSNGSTHSLFDGPGVAHWSFDEGRGSTALDRWGGHTFYVRDPNWVDGGIDISRSSLQTIQDGSFMSVGRNESFTLQFTLQGDLSASPKPDPSVLSATGSGAVQVYAQTDDRSLAIRIIDDQGDTIKIAGIQRTRFPSATTISVVFDREANRIRLYTNNSLVREYNAGRLDAISVDERVRVGGFTTNGSRPVVLSDMRFYTAVNESN